MLDQRSQVQGCPGVRQRWLLDALPRALWWRDRAAFHHGRRLRHAESESHRPPEPPRGGRLRRAPGVEDRGLRRRPRVQQGARVHGPGAHPVAEHGHAPGAVPRLRVVGAVRRAPGRRRRRASVAVQVGGRRVDAAHPAPAPQGEALRQRHAHDEPQVPGPQQQLRVGVVERDHGPRVQGRGLPPAAARGDALRVPLPGESGPLGHGRRRAGHQGVEPLPGLRRGLPPEVAAPRQVRDQRQSRGAALPRRRADVLAQGAERVAEPRRRPGDGGPGPVLPHVEDGPEGRERVGQQRQRRAVHGALRGAQALFYINAAGPVLGASRREVATNVEARTLWTAIGAPIDTSSCSPSSS